MSDWKHIYSTPLQHLALIVEAALADAEFHPVVINKKDTSYHFGFYEVFVHPQEAVEAEIFVNTHFSPNEDE